MTAAPEVEARLQERPRLAKGVRLARDRRRDAWVLQAPERVFVLDEIAHEIVRRCDGRTVAEIVAELGRTFEAEENEIAGDVLALIADLRGKGAMTG